MVLGKDFYDALRADVIDYSAVPYWLEGQAYDTGDVVNYEDQVFASKIDSNTSEPTVTSDWELASKFTTAANQELWDTVLCRYLAVAVLKNSIPGIATPASANGVVKVDGSTFEPAPETSVKRLQEWLEGQYRIARKNLDDFLQENSDEVAYAGYQGFQDDNVCDDVFSSDGQEKKSSGRAGNSTNRIRVA